MVPAPSTTFATWRCRAACVARNDPPARRGDLEHATVTIRRLAHASVERHLVGSRRELLGVVELQMQDGSVTQDLPCSKGGRGAVKAALI